MARPPAPWKRARALAALIRHRQLSPQGFRRLCAVAVAALSLIIVTGAAVRLSGSGLGCPDWPTCADGNIVAPWRYHAWVEFGNRLVTVGLSLLCVLTLAGALVRSRRRRDLTWLSAGLVGGLLAEIVLGGVTVLEKLAPPFVMAHFLLAVVFLADAVVLHHRAGLPEEPVPNRPGRARVSGTAEPLVGREEKWLARMLLVAMAVVVTLGTVVTSTGPHGGNPQAPRFPFSLHDVAQLHGASADVFLVFSALTLGLMVRSGAPRSVIRRGEVLLVALVLEGGIGYTQYFLGVPAALVEVHVTVVVLLVLAVLRFNLGLAVRRPDTPAQAATRPQAATRDPASHLPAAHFPATTPSGAVPLPHGAAGGLPTRTPAARS